LLPAHQVFLGGEVKSQKPSRVNRKSRPTFLTQASLDSLVLKLRFPSGRLQSGWTSARHWLFPRESVPAYRNLPPTS
jgi:hypothetical protein